MKQEPEPVVVEVTESAANSFDLFDHQVGAFGGGVGEPGGVVGEDLVVPGPDGFGEAGELVDVGLVAVAVEPGQSPLGRLDRAGGVGLAKEFFGQIRGADFASGITETQAVFDALPTSLAESLVADEQQPPDPIQGVAFAASMTEGVLLDPTPDIVKGDVGEAYGVKVVYDLAGVG